MQKIASVIDVIMSRAENAAAISLEDYVNPDDGLLYCGKCHTAKQCRVTFRGVEYMPYQNCQCLREAYEAEKDDFRRMQREIEAQHIRANSGITGKLSECRFENYDNTPENETIYRICKKYADNFDTMLSKNQGLLFWGDVGTGKTYSAACIANQLIDSGISVIMTSFVSLLGNSKGFDIDEEMIYNLNQAKLLIIDDLGAERSTDFALEKVYSIIDSRYRSGLPMILTTNLQLSDMTQCVDIRYKRIYERILEVCYPVRISGQSRRKSAAANRFDEMKQFFEEVN